MDDTKKKALEDLIGEAFDKKMEPKEDESEGMEGKCKCGCELLCEGCREKAEDCDCE